MDHRTECDVLLDGKEVPRPDPGGTACMMGTATKDTEGRRAGRKQEHTQQGASEHGGEGLSRIPSGSRSCMCVHLRESPQYRRQVDIITQMRTLRLNEVK